MTSFFLRQTRTVGGIRVLVRESRALCRIWRLNTGRSLLRNQQRPWLSNGREQTAKSGAFGHPSLAVVAWCPSVQQKAGFDTRGTSVADPAVEQRLRLSKILSKESVSTKWKQRHRCPYELARTTARLVARAAVSGFGRMGRVDITSTPTWAMRPCLKKGKMNSGCSFLSDRHHENLMKARSTLHHALPGWGRGGGYLYKGK